MKDCEPEVTPDPDGTPAFGDRVIEHARGFGMRVFVHLAGIAGGLAAGTATSVPTGLGWTAAACVYTGIICIAARGMSRTPSWVIPATAGVVQTVILAVLGLPLYQALFWGGAQTWVQRVFARRMQMGSEWLALLLILPLTIQLLDDLTPIGILSVSFFAVAATARLTLAGIIRRRTRPATTAMKEEEPDTVRINRVLVAELRDKNAALPRNVRGTVEGIASAADNILQCMLADPRDLEPGNRFLKRYLKAAHTVVDKHGRLARERVITPEVISALAQSEEMLGRLESAFSKEHALLLQNDAIDLSAELNVLDTLLKMDGR